MGIEEFDDQHVSRREFMRGVALTAIAATAAGAGAASLVKKSPADTTITAVSEPVISAAPTAVSALVDNPTEALTELAQLQADNLRLQAALTAAEQQLDLMQTSRTDTSAEVDALTLELEDKSHRLSLLSGLLALYEQLDQIELNEIFDNGMTAVSTAITELVDDLPSLEEGIQAGEAALSTFEAQIPLVENGRAWLKDHTGKLQLYFTAIEKVLEKAVDQIGPFLDMLHDWFQDVKKWLPFGIGQKAVEVMDAITILLIETPETISGVQTNLQTPLNQWLSDDSDTPPIQTNLVHPIRQKVLLKASTTTGKAKQVETIYQTQLAAPAETAVSHQNELRKTIAAYKEQHQL